MMNSNDITRGNVSTLLTLAEATPTRIAASTAGFDETYLSTAPDPDTWSALQILNHLRACEEVWMHSIHAMLAFDNPTLKEIHPRQWIKSSNLYTSLPFVGSLRVFTLRREVHVLMLKVLSLEDWARECRIDRKTHSIFTHVRRMVNHEVGHCGEIEALCKKN